MGWVLLFIAGAPISAAPVALSSLFAAIDGDAVWTAAVIAVVTVAAVGTVRVVGSWLLDSAREDFHDSVRNVVREEVREDLEERRKAVRAVVRAELGSIGERLRPQFEAMQADLDECKAQLKPNHGESMNDALRRVEVRQAWVMKAVRAIADFVGLDIDQHIADDLHDDDDVSGHIWRAQSARDRLDERRVRERGAGTDRAQPADDDPGSVQGGPLGGD